MQLSSSRVLSAAALLAVSAFGTSARAAVLYSSLPAVPSSGTEYTLTSNIPADPSNNTNMEGIATYYNTGFASISLSSLEFYGGLPQTTAAQTNGANGDSLELQFYDASGNAVHGLNGEVTNVTTATGPDALYTVSTMKPSFLGGGPITVPGAGYVALIPTNNAPGEPTGTPTPYPANLPTEDLYYTSSTPSVGTSIGTLFGTTGTPPAGSSYATLTTSSTPPGTVTAPAYLELELDGVAVPEPVSLSLIAPAAMTLLGRRRRQ